MRPEVLEEILRNREGQTVEFKESLSAGAQREAIQSLVAFANSDGGSVLFGVRNDGTVKGVQVGENTLENLAGRIARHTYPSLPPAIDEVGYDGKTVVAVEMPRDTPPVIGVYLYSARDVQPAESVDADTVQAYRRVGRTNKKEDFMRLRREQVTDPKVRIGPPNVTRSGDKFHFHGLVWVEEGSGTAQNIAFRFEPPIADSSDTVADLPHSYGKSEPGPGRITMLPPTRYYISYGSDYSFWRDGVPKRVPGNMRIVAAYRDDWGLVWEASRRLDVMIPEPGRISLADRGEFRRRILQFPPKSASGA